VRHLFLTLTFASLFVVGCRADLHTPAHRAHAVHQTTGVTHVVLCWLNNPNDEAARQKIIDASHEFASIPGVVRIACGRPLASTRLSVDSTFDVGIVMTFESESALRAYEQHPIHQRAVAEVLRPLAKRIVIYDFTNAAPSH
jgi:hypothetical protein